MARSSVRPARATRSPSGAAPAEWYATNFDTRSGSPASTSASTSTRAASPSAVARTSNAADDSIAWSMPHASRRPLDRVASSSTARAWSADAETGTSTFSANPLARLGSSDVPSGAWVTSCD